MLDEWIIKNDTVNMDLLEDLKIILLYWIIKKKLVYLKYNIEHAFQYIIKEGCNELHIVYDNAYYDYVIKTEYFWLDTKS